MSHYSFFLALFVLVKGVLSADPISVGSPRKWDKNVPVKKTKKWSLYKTRFNQTNSTPLESLAYAGSVSNLDELWERLGGMKAFMETDRVDYDIFDLSRSAFHRIRTEKQLNFKALKRVNGTVASFNVKPQQSNFFDSVLRSIFTGNQKSVSLSKVFCFSLCRKYKWTLVKFWTFEGKDCRPLYQSIRNALDNRDIGMASEKSVHKYCLRIIRSSGFALMDMNKKEHDSKLASTSDEQLLKEGSDIDSDFNKGQDNLSEGSHNFDEFEDVVIFGSSNEFDQLEKKDSPKEIFSNEASFEKGSPRFSSLSSSSIPSPLNSVKFQDNVSSEDFFDKVIEFLTATKIASKEIPSIANSSPIMPELIPREKLTSENAINQIISMPLTEKDLFNFRSLFNQIRNLLGSDEEI